MGTRAPLPSPIPCHRPTIVADRCNGRGVSRAAAFCSPAGSRPCCSAPCAGRASYPQLREARGAHWTHQGSRSLAPTPAAAAAACRLLPPPARTHLLHRCSIPCIAGMPATPRPSAAHTACCSSTGWLASAAAAGGWPAATGRRCGPLPCRLQQLTAVAGGHAGLPGARCCLPQPGAGTRAVPRPAGERVGRPH